MLCDTVHGTQLTDILILFFLSSVCSIVVFIMQQKFFLTLLVTENGILNMSHLTRCVICHNVSLGSTSAPAKWHLNPLNGLISDHECDR